MPPGKNSDNALLGRLAGLLGDRTDRNDATHFHGIEPFPWIRTALARTFYKRSANLEDGPARFLLYLKRVFAKNRETVGTDPAQVLGGSQRTEDCRLFQRKAQKGGDTEWQLPMSSSSIAVCRFG
jgi:hypothetical protein